MATVISKFDPKAKFIQNLDVLKRCLVDNSKEEFKASKEQVYLMRNFSSEVFRQIDIHKVYENYFNKCHVSKNILFLYKKDPRPIELKNVYFQNQEDDIEEIQTLDEGSTFYTRLKIKGFDFRKNIQFANINLSALLFFHEMTTDGLMIKQPIVPIDEDNFSSSYQQNYKKLNDTKMKNPFHFFLYYLENTKKENECDSSEYNELSKFLYTIHPDHQTLDVGNKTNDTSVCIRINEDYFSKHLIPFINEISNLDLFTFEGMIAMDKSIRNLSLSNQSSNIFIGGGYNKYTKFFKDSQPTVASKQKSIYDTYHWLEQKTIFETYRLFNLHFRNLCRLRFGTIRGLKEMYSFSHSFNNAVKSGLWNYDGSFPPRFGHISIITNLDDEELDQNWETQVNLIRERSKINCPDIDDIKETHDIYNDSESIVVNDSNIIDIEDNIETSSTTEHGTLSKVELLVKKILSNLNLDLSTKLFDIESKVWGSIQSDVKDFGKYSNPNEWANDGCISFWNQM